MSRFSLPVALALLLAGTANADHHHKVWNKFFAGSWELQETGDSLDLKIVADGTAAIGTGTSATGEGSAWIMGWDPAKRLIVHQWFGVDHGRVLFESLDDTTLRGAGEIHGPNQLTKGTVTIRKQNNDSFAVHWTEVTVNGQTADDIRIVVTRKSSTAKAQISSREDFKEYCQLVEGRWICTDVKLPAVLIGSSGDKVTAYGINEIVVDGHALQSVWYGAASTAKWMTVFDNESSQIREFFVASDGSTSKSVLSRKDGKWTRTATLCRPDGTMQEVIAKLISVSNDGNVHTWKDSRAEGPHVYRRVSK